MSIRTTLLAIALVAPFAASAAAESAERPAHEEFLLGLGIGPEDLDQVVVEQRTWDGAAWTTRTLALDEIPTMPAVAPAGGPHATVGQVPLHVMFQLSCDGYGAQALPGGVTAISGSWDAGLHLLVGAIAGGVVVDTQQPDATLLVGAHADNAATAAGQLSLSETRISLFGFCLALFGQMGGTGAFLWDERLL